MKVLLSLMVLFSVSNAYAQADAKGNGNGDRTVHTGEVLNEPSLDLQGVNEAFDALQLKIKNLSIEKNPTDQAGDDAIWTRLTPTGQKILKDYDEDVLSWIGNLSKGLDVLKAEVIPMVARMNALKSNRSRFVERSVQKQFDERIQIVRNEITTLISEHLAFLGYQLMYSSTTYAGVYFTNPQYSYSSQLRIDTRYASNRMEFSTFQHQCDTAVCLDLLRQKETQFLSLKGVLMNLNIRLVGSNGSLRAEFDDKRGWLKPTILYPDAAMKYNETMNWLSRESTRAYTHQLWILAEKSLNEKAPQ